MTNKNTHKTAPKGIPLHSEVDPAGVVEALVNRVKAAQEVYAQFTQEHVDRIFELAAIAANKQRISLAKAAKEETGMGLVEDKITKNHFASEYIYNKYRDMKTCGTIDRDDAAGIIKVAEPLGIIAGVIPVTNPTSTAIFKSLLALKTRNGIIFSPHPRAKNCTIAAAKVVLDAAIQGGAPRDIIAWIDEPTLESSNALMQHPGIATILATGGPGMVKAAYSSGKPALGVGAGNTPAVIDETADIRMAISSILISKTFDNGMICASEQALVVVDSVYESVKEHLIAARCMILNKDQRDAVGKTIIIHGRLNAEIVGQPASVIAHMAGIEIAAETKVLVGEVTRVAMDEPFAHEKLSPVLGLFKAKDFANALDIASALLTMGGMGHTSVLYTNQNNVERIKTFGERMKTGRTLINMPASQGAIGDLYNFSLCPSLTLGCGSWGGNSVSENLTPEHLLNIKTVAMRKENLLWFKVPEKVYFKRGSLEHALNDLAGKKKAFIVTDRFLFDNGLLAPLIEKLGRLGILFDVFADVEPDPTIATARKGVHEMAGFKPDVIIAIGGGSPMDAAKIMWLLYEHPEADFENLAMRFMDIRKRVYTFPKLGRLASFVAIPTTSGTGSEVTPFAVITDEKTGMKYPIADYELTPDIAIIDADLAARMPKNLTAYSGIDALTHALEAMVSVVATEFTTPYALEATRLIFEYLPKAYALGEADMDAREKVHHASAMAGMAFANAFLGACHSMAHKLGAYFHLPHGLANALLIEEVMHYNAAISPTKQGVFPQYTHPQALERYARMADYCGLGGTDPIDKCERLIAKVAALKEELGIPKSIAEAGIDKNAFMAKLDEMVEAAYDDQCTGANPRIPMMSEMKELYLQAYSQK